MGIYPIAKKTILCLLLGFSSLLLAAQSPKLYQVDLIAFRLLAEPSQNASLAENLLGERPKLEKAVALQTKADKSKPAAYQLLAWSKSGLEKQAWTLAHSKEYRVVFQQSWLQPLQAKPAAIRLANRDGFDVQGTLSLSRSRFLQLDLHLFFLAQDLSRHSVNWQQRQALKPDKIYYLDNPDMAVLIRVHPIV